MLDLCCHWALNVVTVFCTGHQPVFELTVAVFFISSSKPRQGVGWWLLCETHRAARPGMLPTRRCLRTMAVRGPSSASLVDTVASDGTASTLWKEAGRGRPRRYAAASSWLSFFGGGCGASLSGSRSGYSARLASARRRSRHSPGEAGARARPSCSSGCVFLVFDGPGRSWRARSRSAPCHALIAGECTTPWQGCGRHLECNGYDHAAGLCSRGRLGTRPVCCRFHCSWLRSSRRVPG